MIEPDERAAAAARQILLARAMRIGWLSLSIDMARLRLALRRFNPAQLRIPAGQTGGGRWTGEGDTVAPTPAADSPAREVTIDASGATVETTRRADGSVATQTVLNRDGSAIRSEYGAGNGADERHTVVLPDGTVRQFETTGDVQTIRDGNGETLSRSRWTADGPVSEPAPVQEATIQQVAAPALLLPLAPQISAGAVAAAAGTTAAGLALYNWLSSRNDANQYTVASFTARDYQSVEGVTSVTTRTREELSGVCNKIADVQTRVDRITGDVRSERSGLSPTQFGTEVHTRLKYEINGTTDPKVPPIDENYRAEVSLLKTKEVGYGVPGTIRVDVFERPEQSTVCVYDVKTGVSGLTEARYAEMYARAQASFGGVSRVVVMEVRPFQ